MPNTTTSQTITPDTFPAGTRVVFTVGANAGTEATVTGWVRDSIGVRFDNGGTHVFPASHGGIKPAEVADTTTIQHGASHTTRTVHLAVKGGYDGERLVQLCGMGRRQTAYLYATDEAVTCKRCLALPEAAAEVDAEPAEVVPGAGCGKGSDGQPCSPAYLCPACIDLLLAQEAADIAAEDAERAAQLEAVRDIYGDAAAWLVEAGWTVDAAISHVTGVCDLEVCGGEHGTAWAIMVADATGRPEAAQAQADNDLARSMAAVREAAVAAGRTDVVDALDALEAKPDHVTTARRLTDAEAAARTQVKPNAVDLAWVEDNRGLVLEDAANRITARLTPMFHGGWLWLVTQGSRAIGNGTAPDLEVAKAAAADLIGKVVAEQPRCAACSGPHYLADHR